MNKYNKGSILLEAVAAMGVVVITIMMSYKICSFAEKNIISSKESFNDREAIKAVCSEVKYNIKFEELKNVLKNGSLFIKYDNDFLSRLSSEDLLSLECDGEENDKKIVIEVIDDKDEKIKLKIQLFNDSDKLDAQVIKGEWMDYV